MGNIDSKYQFEHGNIYCQTDKAYFVAGEQITGKIYLNLSMSYPASSLEIEVKGKEKCKWKTRENKEIKDGENTRHEFQDVIHKGERNIITYKVPVYYFPGGFAPAGQYTFPFSFALPSNLPATLFFCGLDKAVATIKYKLKAILETSIGFNAKKMKFKQTLIIRQPGTASSLNPLQRDERNVYACCCFGNKGTAKITTQFEKDAYTPDEVCRAMCDVDNSQCTKEINDISIRLMQHVELKAKDGQIYTENRLLESKRFDGLGANQATGGMNRYLELSLAGIRQQARPFDDNKSLDKDDLFLAERIQPTAKGTIVKLHYTLTIHCNYGSVCAEEPHCTIPLTITPPPLPSFGVVQAPAGWNPTVFGCFDFHLPGPGEVLSAVVPTVQPVSGNINFNMNVGHEEVKVNTNIIPKVKLQIDTDRINMDVPIPAPAPVHVPVPQPVRAEVSIPVPQPVQAHGHMNVPVPMPMMSVKIDSHDSDYSGENVSMNVGFGGMNMQMEGNMTSNVSYTSETKVNGVTTSYTHTSSHDNVPVPVPVPAPVPAPGPANAAFTMNTNLGMGMDMGMGMNMNVNIDANNGDSSDEEGHMNAQFNMPGMNMNMNFNSNH